MFRLDSRSCKEKRVQGGDSDTWEGCCKDYIDGEHERELQIRDQGEYEKEREENGVVMGS